MTQKGTQSIAGEKKFKATQQQQSKASNQDGRWGGGRGHPYKFNGGTPIAKKFDLCVLLALLLFEFG